MRIASALLFILILDGLFFLTQVSMDSISTEIGGSTDFYGMTDTALLHQAQYNNTYSLADPSIPSGTTGSSDTGIFFIDGFLTARDWISNTAGYIWNFINAVPRFLNAINAPIEVSFVVGAIWHILTLFLVIGKLLNLE